MHTLSCYTQVWWISQFCQFNVLYDSLNKKMHFNILCRSIANIPTQNVENLLTKKQNKIQSGTHWSVLHSYTLDRYFFGNIQVITWFTSIIKTIIKFKPIYKYFYFVSIFYSNIIIVTSIWYKLIYVLNHYFIK